MIRNIFVLLNKFRLDFFIEDVNKTLQRKYKIIEDDFEEMQNIDDLDAEDYDRLQSVIWNLSQIINTLYQIRNDSDNKIESYIEQVIYIHKKLVVVLKDKSELMNIDYEELEYLTRKMNHLINSRL